MLESLSIKILPKKEKQWLTNWERGTLGDIWDTGRENGGRVDMIFHCTFI